MTEKKINILLVEDDVFLANIYKTKFAMEGFEVVHAENGDLAIVEANRKKPDIILLDILLPKKDGFAVLTELKKENSEVKDIPVIQNLSLTAPKGSLVAIVGPTGAGKTTLINLLMRFYDADSGSITLDGFRVDNITRKDLRLAYSMVLQDTWLFHGTVYENVTYGRQNATMDEVISACKAANIHNYIENLPDGYETMINDDGTNISKGQKQLLTIARAMLMNTSLLILDEATSNVDTRTELNIQQAMRTLMSDKTCFIIAHRLSTIQNADHILVVNNGRIIEQGNHKELLKLKGFYSEMFYSQFS